MPPSIPSGETEGERPIQSMAGAKDLSGPTTRSGTKGKSKSRSPAASSSPRRKRPYTPPKSFQGKVNIKKNEPAFLSLCQLTTYIVEHQISLPLTILSGLTSVHLCAPFDSDLRRSTQKFFSISYQNPSTGLYSKGFDDGYFVAFWVVMFTLIRAVLMDYVFIPFARNSGLKKKASIRFGEQAWSFLYAFTFWNLGMYLCYNTKYWMNFKELWTDWPIREVSGLFKWYYLVQYAFWIQQIFVLNIEERRKDFHQMFAHHLVTCSLIYGSYVYHMTRVGNVILCVMDITDILLPFAKMLKYLKFQKCCDIAFGVFMLAWFVGRHLVYPGIIFSAHSDSPREIPFGCYNPTSVGNETYKPLDDTAPTAFDMFFKPKETVCFNRNILSGFLVLLWTLEGITLMWFYMIVRVAVKVLKGGEAEDDRSEDEEEEEVEEVEMDEAASHELNSKIGHELAAAYPDTHIGDFGIGSSSSTSSGINMVSNGAPGPSTRRKRENGTPIPAIFKQGKERASEFFSPQKLAESKIGCGSEDR